MTLEHSCLLQIEVRGVEGPLKDAAEKVLTMKPNFSYTLQEVEDEVAHVFELGWFARCQPNAEDTRDGVKLTIEVSLPSVHLGSSQHCESETPTPLWLEQVKGNQSR